MIEINENNITLTRGDTFRTQIRMRDKKTKLLYKPVAGDVIKFGAKKNPKDTEYVIEKTISYKTMLLEILPADTKYLPFGTKLYYDVQITFSDGTVDTFMSGEINITTEIYTG